MFPEFPLLSCGVREAEIVLTLRHCRRLTDSGVWQVAVATAKGVTRSKARDIRQWREIGSRVAAKQRKITG